MFNFRLFSEYTNLARLGVASQSDTLDDFSADKTIDGDTTTFANTATGGPTVWWKVVLPSRSFINNIQIYNRHNCCQDRIEGVTVWVDEEQVGTVVYESGKISYSFNDLSRFGEKVTVKGGGSVLNLAEVEVYGMQIGPEIDIGE